MSYSEKPDWSLALVEVSIHDYVAGVQIRNDEFNRVHCSRYSKGMQQI